MDRKELEGEIQYSANGKVEEDAAGRWQTQSLWLSHQIEVKQSL